MLAVANPKGGCGKTTTAVSLAGALAHAGACVLLVDADPQAHATLALGLRPADLDRHLYDVLASPGGHLADIVRCRRSRLDLAPAGADLGALEGGLPRALPDGRSARLRTALDALRRRYDWVVVDCPPRLGVLTFCALRAAREILIPVDMSAGSLRSAVGVAAASASVAASLREPRPVHVLATAYDGRSRFARGMLDAVRHRFGPAASLDTVIRRCAKLGEATRRGVPIGSWAPHSAGAADHQALAVELDALGRGVPGRGTQPELQVARVNATPPP